MLWLTTLPLCHPDCDDDESIKLMFVRSYCHENATYFSWWISSLCPNGFGPPKQYPARTSYKWYQGRHLGRLEGSMDPQGFMIPKFWSSIGLYCVNCTKFGQLFLRKIIQIVATRCHILRVKCTKFDFGWGSAPCPAGGAYSAPQTS